MILHVKPLVQTVVRDVRDIAMVVQDAEIHAELRAVAGVLIVTHHVELAVMADVVVVVTAVVQAVAMEAATPDAQIIAMDAEVLAPIAAVVAVQAHAVEDVTADATAVLEHVAADAQPHVSPDVPRPVPAVKHVQDARQTARQAVETDV